MIRPSFKSCVQHIKSFRYIVFIAPCTLNPTFHKKNNNFGLIRQKVFCQCERESKDISSRTLHNCEIFTKTR